MAEKRTFKMSKKTGWISLHRKIQDNWIFKKQRVFSEFEAWIDILLQVNHFDAKVLIGKTLLEVKAGESLNSLETWGKRWGWTRSTVRRFLILLQNDSMIVLKNEQKTTRITVCNFDSYQNTRNANETQMKRKRNANETQTDTNNNDNNINNEKNENNILLKKESKEYLSGKKPDTVNWNNLLKLINEIFGKNFKVVSLKVKNAFKARFKEGYTKKDIENSMLNAKKDTFHIEKNYLYCTLEYFSRSQTLDKYSNAISSKKEDLAISDEEFNKMLQETL